MARRARMRSPTMILNYYYYYYHCHHQLLNISPSTSAIIVDECEARVMLSLIEFLQNVVGSHYMCFGSNCRIARTNRLLKSVAINCIPPICNGLFGNMKNYWMENGDNVDATKQRFILKLSLNP